jgi:hypothetical protein
LGLETLGKTWIAIRFQLQHQQRIEHPPSST